VHVNHASYLTVLSNFGVAAEQELDATGCRHVLGWRKVLPLDVVDDTIKAARDRPVLEIRPVKEAVCCGPFDDFPTPRGT
jgi:hypothetical protein